MSFVPSPVYQHLPKDDVFLLRRKQYKKWEHFFFDQMDPPAEMPEVRDVILQSWNRCKKYENLNPMIQGSVKNIPDEKLNEIKETNEVFHLAKPVLKQVEQSLSHTKHVIMFCDSDGIILECYGDRDVLRQIGNSTNATKGSQWSERWAGTNAIGTSIYLKKPVQIFSSEHFAHGCHEWVCSSAPILNPLTNELMGVINVSTTADGFHPLSMMKTIEIVNQIERILFHNHYQAREMMQNIFIEAISKWKNHMVILCDAKGNILRHNMDSPAEQLASHLSNAIETNKSRGKKEWKEEVTLHGQSYQARFRKIFWYDRFIGLIAVLGKKIQS